MLFVEYPRCSTCKKAKKFLEDNGIKFEDRDIVVNTPTKEELDAWVNLSGYDVKKFFNTSGIKYRELNLKDTILSMSYEEKLKVLASDGMLIKRPILVADNFVLVGFNENKWRDKLL